MELPAFAIIALKLLAVIALVSMNGFFVAAEFALVKVRDTQLDPLIAKGQKRAKVVRTVIRNLDSSLSACQLGITLASLGLGWVGEPVFKALLAPILDLIGVQSLELRHSLSIVVGFSAITFLHITAGEQAPKWLAIQKSMPAALFVARPLRWFHMASYPFIWILNHSSQAMLRLAGIEPGAEGESSHSEEELRLLFAVTQKESGRSRLGRDIVLNALDLRRRLVREVMRPRQEIATLDTGATIAECIDLAEKTRFSRFPLCEDGNVDKTLGVVHIKDLYAMRSKAKTGQDLLPVARKLIYLPASARLEKLLQLFLDRKLHVAMVIDEYGGTLGVVTLENVLEELVGQIQDEFDQEEKPRMTKIGANAWDVSGLLPLHELADLVGEPIGWEGVTTTSGWVTQKLGGFPKAGDVVSVGNCELRVEEMDGLRVARLRLTRADQP